MKEVLFLTRPRRLEAFSEPGKKEEKKGTDNSPLKESALRKETPINNGNTRNDSSAPSNRNQYTNDEKTVITEPKQKSKRNPLLIIIAVIAAFIVLRHAVMPDDSGGQQTASSGEEQVITPTSTIPTETPAPSADYELYKPILQKVYSDQNGIGDPIGTKYIPYGIYDWDGDGVGELFVRTGTAGVEYEWHIYTIKNGETQELCCLSGLHRVISICPTGGIYLVFQQIIVKVLKITYDGQRCESKDLGKVSEEEIPDEYSNFLELKNVTDYSLLE